MASQVCWPDASLGNRLRFAWYATTGPDYSSAGDPTMSLPDHLGRKPALVVIGVAEG